MKKLILSISAVAGLTMAGNAQQVLFVDDNAANPISTDVTISGVVSTADENATLLVGTTAGNVTTDVVTLLLSGATASATTALGTTQPAAGDVSSLGLVADQTANTYKVAAGTAYYQIELWSGTQYSSYAAALAGGGVVAGASPVLAFDNAPASGAPAVEEDLPSSINLIPISAVPEPSTYAMAGVGLASMLIFRRRNK
jgi:hypothetical protein